MERRVFFLCLLSFLIFAEGLSWWTAKGLGPCLIQPEHSQQATNNNEHQDCPTFFAGSLLIFDRAYHWIKHDDNDKAVVAGFTIVLAISTILLWLATNKLWQAGERQLELIAKSSADQSRDMQASIAAAQRSADAAMLSARAAIALQLPIFRITPDNPSWGDSKIGENTRAYCHVSGVKFQNIGATKAIPIEIRYGYVVGDALPEVPNFQWVDRFLPENIFEPNASTTPYKRLTGDTEMQPEDWSLINTNAKSLWFFCEFTFEDFMDMRHDVGMCWKWTYVGSGSAWRRDRTAAYNRKT